MDFINYTFGFREPVLTILRFSKNPERVFYFIPPYPTLRYTGTALLHVQACLHRDDVGHFQSLQLITNPCPSPNLPETPVKTHHWREAWPDARCSLVLPGELQFPRKSIRLVSQIETGLQLQLYFTVGRPASVLRSGSGLFPIAATAPAAADAPEAPPGGRTARLRLYHACASGAHLA